MDSCPSDTWRPPRLPIGHLPLIYVGRSQQYSLSSLFVQGVFLACFKLRLRLTLSFGKTNLNGRRTTEEPRRMSIRIVEKTCETSLLLRDRLDFPANIAKSRIERKGRKGAMYVIRGMSLVLHDSSSSRASYARRTARYHHGLCQIAALLLSLRQIERVLTSKRIFN